MTTVVGPTPTSGVAEHRSVLRALWNVRVTVVYTALLVVAAVAMSNLSDAAQNRLLLQTSTNLHNLTHGHFGTLIGSAFVTDGGAIWVWLPGLVCLLAVAEVVWHGRRLLAFFVIGHVGATLLVALGLFVAVHFGLISRGVVRAEDVGVSYGAAAVIGALTWSLPRAARLPWASMWFAVGVGSLAIAPSFTACGHLTALTLGVVLAAVWGRSQPAQQYSRGRIVVLRVLLGIGTVFGLAEIGWQEYWWSVPVVALLAAGTALLIDRQWILG